MAKALFNKETQHLCKFIVKNLIRETYTKPSKQTINTRKLTKLNSNLAGDKQLYEFQMSNMSKVGSNMQ